MHIASLYRYPVKGLTPEPLQNVQLSPARRCPSTAPTRSRTAPAGSTPTHRGICPRSTS